MAEKKWTSPQLDAISANDKTLLVSAAAGSGKTAVLTERIIRRLTAKDNPLDISEIAVVTFTKAASGELKDRIAKRLSVADGDKATSKRLFSQLINLPNAKISTIHSFCLNMIMENFNLLSLPAGMKVGDETQLGELAEKAAEAVINGYYAKKSEEFVLSEYDIDDFHLLSEVCSSARSDTELTALLTDVYAKSRNFPYPVMKFKMINETLIKENAEMRSGRLKLFDSTLGRVMLSNIKDELMRCEIKTEIIMSVINDNPGDYQKNALPFFKNEKLIFEHLIALAEKHDYYSMQSYINNVSFSKRPTLAQMDKDTAKQLDANRKFFKDKVSDLKAIYFAMEPEEMLSENESVLKMQKVFCSMLADFEALYTKYKLGNGVFDYGDLEHLALKLLCKNKIDFSVIEKTPVAERYTKEIKELYVDEYQDTNPIQDAVFRAVSTEKSLFMVGDPKQSIYRFRGAIPEIFINYKKVFPKYETDEKSNNGTVYLSDNFRSSSAIINLTNDIFSVLLNTDSENPLYTEDDRLVFSRDKDTDKAVTLALCYKGDNADDSDDDDEKSSNDCEGFYIASQIKELISDGYEYKDIIVLSRSNDMLSSIRGVFETMHIPCTASAGNDFFKTSEILFITSLLRTIDNPTLDMYLIGSMASPVFRFTPDELLDIRNSGGSASFWHSLCGYAEGKHSYSEKAKDFLDRLEMYRSLSRKLTAEKFIRRLYALTGTPDIFSVIGSSDDSSVTGEKRRRNLMLFYTIAKNYCEFSSGSLSGFCDYVDSMHLQEKLPAATESSENRVSLMTIHGSKGLEAPCVFLCGTGKGFNGLDERKSCIVDDDLGPTFFTTDDRVLGKLNTHLRDAAAYKSFILSHEEEKRVLYVALTRARERLFITGKLKKRESMAKQLGEIKAGGKRNASQLCSNSFLDYIISALSDNKVLSDALEDYINPDCIKPIYKTDGRNLSVFIASFADYCDDNISEIDLDEKPHFSEGRQASELDVSKKYIEFNYPEQKRCHIPKKLSVSELKDEFGDDTPDDGIKEKKAAPAYPKKLTDFIYVAGGRKASSAFIGTAMHTFMQFADFRLCEREGTQRVGEFLLRDEFISKEQFDALDFERLQCFFTSELYMKLKKSENVKREFEFDILIPANELIKTDESSGILLQGIIDCFFENEDGSLTVFDFKTDRTKNEEELRNRHSGQMMLYRRALPEITGKQVRDSYIYSFELGKAIKIQ